MRYDFTEEELKVETWETLTPGFTSLLRHDRKTDDYEKVLVGGKSPGRRIKITVGDRRYYQSQILEENVAHDPFKNGRLRRVDGPVVDDIDETYHFTDEDYGKIIGTTNAKAFQAKVLKIDSELVLRRLKDIAEEHATATQFNFIKKILKERYPIGGPQISLDPNFEGTPL